MTSLYNRKIEFIIFWLGADNEINSSRLERLKTNQIEVTSFTDENQLRQAMGKTEPDLLVISNNEKPEEIIETGLALKSLANKSEMTLMVITDNIPKESREYFYQSGGNELVIEPASLIEIYFRIRHLKYVFDNKNNSNIQIEEASQMALLPSFHNHRT